MALSKILLRFLYVWKFKGQTKSACKIIGSNQSNNKKNSSISRKFINSTMCELFNSKVIYLNKSSFYTNFHFCILVLILWISKIWTSLWRINVIIINLFEKCTKILRYYISYRWYIRNITLSFASFHCNFVFNGSEKKKEKFFGTNW